MSSISTSSPTPWVDTESLARAARSIKLHTDPTSHQFTVKQADHAYALDAFMDAARFFGVKLKLEFDQPKEDDYGGGHGIYHNVKFSFVPDRPDGSFSDSYSKNIQAALRLSERWMKNKGIIN